MTPVRRSRLGVALLGITLYWAIAFVPKWYPPFGGTAFYFFYLLSLPLTLLVLVALATWALFGILIALLRKRPVTTRHRSTAVFVAAAVTTALVVYVIHLPVPSSLPSGSDLQRFDSGIWQDSTSWTRTDDNTARQEMLADLVDIVLVGRTGGEIERLLGPSLDTPYFRSTSRDMIYYLGPERDALFGLDSEWLLIWLDEDGVFARFAIHVD